MRVSPAIRLNSLPVKLLGLFVLVLMGTVATAFTIGLSTAQRAVESEIKTRTVELATETANALSRAGNDDGALSKELSSAIRLHRGQLLRAELSRQAALGNDADFNVAYTEGETTLFDSWRGPVNWEGGRAFSKSINDDQGRSLLVSHPFTYVTGRRARLTLTTSLQEASRITQAERSALLPVALASALFLSMALWFVVSRILVGRVRALESSMRAVEGGQLDVEVQAPESGGDELSYLARGFNRMIEEIRDFNAELTGKVEAATAELTKKNKALEELNELLVVARRDLTAQERLAALGQLAGTIAHELGNPLNAVSGHVQLLARRSDLPEPAKNQVQIVGNEVQRMAQIIRRFLDQTRGFTPASEQTKLTPLIDEALDVTLGQEARARLSIVREVDPAAERVRTDPGLVRHLLINLIANAADAMPQGGNLAVRARRNGPNLVLEVADSGTGMPAEVKRHIFEPFFTTKAQGKGTGLGLAICKEIARGFKGRLDVESEPGKGSAFTAQFPAESWSEPVPPVVPIPEIPSAPTAP